MTAGRIALLAAIGNNDAENSRHGACFDLSATPIVRGEASSPWPAATKLLEWNLGTGKSLASTVLNGAHVLFVFPGVVRSRIRRIPIITWCPSDASL